MGFALFIVYLVVTFVRPGEQIPALRGWELMDVTSGLALAAAAAAIAVAIGRGPSFRAVQIPLMLALCAWSMVSVVASPLRSATALEGVLGFAKSSGTAFLLVMLNVDTARRLRIVAVVLTLLSLFVVGQAALAYHLGIGASEFLVETGTQPASSGGDDLLEAPSDNLGSEAAGESARIRGLGFLNDPNDLACTLVAILSLTLALRRKGAYLPNALLVWIPAGVVVYGIYLTRSRGGVLAFAGVLALSVRERLGRTLSILAGAGALMAILALGFLGSRSMSIDASATGRIEAWSAGLQMLKSSPIWGVGFGLFTEYNDKVAHNSFVHCFAELGLVGYFLWLSLIMLTLDDMRSIVRDKNEEVADLQRWARALTISLIGFLIGGLFLSRSYDVTLFILLGLGAALADMARRRGHLPGSRSVLLWIYSVIAVQIASIVIIWLYMRLLR